MQGSGAQVTAGMLVVPRRQASPRNSVSTLFQHGGGLGSSIFSVPIRWQQEPEGP